MDENRLIGRDGGLPWRLPDDMGWFREHTIGKPCIIGRKTYESFPDRFRPLLIGPISLSPVMPVMKHRERLLFTHWTKRWMPLGMRPKS
ncbi:MAG: dihydrofolate reductase [Chloroflexota bacterium]